MKASQLFVIAASDIESGEVLPEATEFESYPATAPIGRYRVGQITVSDLPVNFIERHPHGHGLHFFPTVEDVHRYAPGKGGDPCQKTP